MSIYKTFLLYQGTTFCPESINLLNSTGLPINLVGYSVVGRMAQSFYSESFVELTTEITSYTSATIQISLTPEQTATISPGRYVFEIILIDVNDTIHRLVDGIIEVVPGIGLTTTNYQ